MSIESKILSEVELSVVSTIKASEVEGVSAVAVTSVNLTSKESKPEKDKIILESVTESMPISYADKKGMVNSKTENISNNGFMVWFKEEEIYKCFLKIIPKVQ